MSNETKEKTAAVTAAENMAQAEAATAPKEGKAQQAAENGTAGKNGSKGKKPAKAQTGNNAGGNALQAVGKAACKRHKLAAVWVTDDGQCFPQESDARAHGKNLGNPEPLKVEA